MEKEKRCCGNCRYADYYRRKCKPLTAWVECEVYSTKKERGHKPCHNWKEKKLEG